MDYTDATFHAECCRAGEGMRQAKRVLYDWFEQDYDRCSILHRLVCGSVFSVPISQKLLVKSFVLFDARL